MINTLRATFGPVYRFLKGMVLPSESNIGRFSIFFRVCCVGRSLFVLTSPSKSAVLSMSSRLFGDSSVDCLGGAVDISFTSPFEVAVAASFSGVLLESAVTTVSLVKGASDDIAMVKTWVCWIFSVIARRVGSGSSDSCTVCSLCHATYIQRV
jgi:hypothetical protein